MELVLADILEELKKISRALEHMSKEGVLVRGEFSLALEDEAEG